MKTSSILCVALLFSAGISGLVAAEDVKPSKELGTSMDQGVDIDSGIIDGNIYKNKYFEMQMTLPEKWSVMSSKTKAMIAKVGEDVIAGDDAFKRNVIKQSLRQSANLIGISKYPMGAAVDFNPNIQVVVERVEQFPGIVKGADYLFHVKNMLKSSSADVVFPSDFYTKTISNIDFDVMDVEMNIGDKTIKQKYYASIIKEYAMGIVVSYDTPEEFDDMDKIISKTRFDR